MLVLTALLAAAAPPAVAGADRSGPDRPARCRIDAAPPAPCRFTPLFADGSFEVATGPDRALRLVMGDGDAGLFEAFGPDRRVPLPGRFRRDPRDRACWVTDDPDAAVRRLCADRAR